MSSPGLIGQALDKLFRNSKRATINDNPHFVPINLEIAELTLASVLRKAGDELDDPGIVSNVPNIISGIEAYVLQKHKGRLDLQNLPQDYYVNPSKYLPAVVYSKGKVVGAMYGSYDKAYSGLFKDYLNKQVSKFLSQKRYDDNLKQRQLEAAAAGKKEAREYKVGYDVGHLISDTSPYTVSPAYLKLVDAIKTIEDMLGGNTVIADAEIPPALISKHRSDLTKLKTQIQSNLDKLKSRSTFGTQISVELQKDIDLDNFLASSKAIVVIVQDRLENQYFYGTKLEGETINAVFKLLATVNYSKNVIEEVTTGVVNALTGRKNVRKKIPKKLPDIKIKPNPLNNKITSGPKTAPQKKSPKSVKVERDSYLDLFALQTFINAHLQDVISANMGDGSRKDILNYRTGRLASSIKVEKMSQSRQGMITAFYSYMKNPYATFSDGGRQEFPKTRDPKLLISKSIREIAAEKVSNRLRAVVI